MGTSRARKLDETGDPVSYTRRSRGTERDPVEKDRRKFVGYTVPEDGVFSRRSVVTGQVHPGDREGNGADVVGEGGGASGDASPTPEGPGVRGVGHVTLHGPCVRTEPQV